MNPANGPNARLLHPYRPPSSGWREDRNTMHTDKGRNITMPPNTHTISELGPVAAAVAVHCRLQPAVTMNSTTSRTPSARARGGAGGAELIVPLESRLLLARRGASISNDSVYGTAWVLSRKACGLKRTLSERLMGTLREGARRL